MTKYERLLDDIELSGIYYVRTNGSKSSTQSMESDGECAIFIEEGAFETDADRTVASAHEKGHCDSGAFYTVHTPFETRGRCERRAWKRAIAELIPFDELMDAVDACRTVDGVTVYDLAEHLSVTPEFVTQAVEQYVIWGKMIL